MFNLISKFNEKLTLQKCSIRVRQSEYCKYSNSLEESAGRKKERKEERETETFTPLAERNGVPHLCPTYMKWKINQTPECTEPQLC